MYIIYVMIINNKKKGEKMVGFYNDIIGVGCPILNFNIFVGVPVGLVWFALVALEVI